MKTHLAATALTDASSWPAFPFRRVASLVVDRNTDLSAPPLSVSSDGRVSQRDGDGRQASSDSTIRNGWVCRPGDLIVNPMWLIGGGIAVSNIAGSVSPDYRVYRLHEVIYPAYMHHLLRSVQYRSQYKLYTRAESTFDRRVSKDDFHDMPVLVPPIEEQQRVADFLDDQVTLLDRAIELRQDQSRLMRRRSLRLLRSAVESRGCSTPSNVPWLPYMDEDWRVSRLKYHAFCLDSRRIPLSSEERAPRKGPYPYYGASKVVDYLDDYLFDEELVLVGEDGASLDNPDFDVVQRVSGPCWVNNHAHVLRALPTLLPDYLAEYLRGADRWFMISGATRPKITQEDLMALPIVVPPLPVQANLVDEMKRVSGRQEQALAVSSRHNELLKERKQALITAAVTGQFDVTTARAVA